MATKKNKMNFKQPSGKAKFEGIVIHINDRIIIEDNTNDLLGANQTDLKMLIDTLKQNGVTTCPRAMNSKYFNIIRKKELIARDHEYYKPLRSLINYWLIKGIDEDNADELVKLLIKNYPKEIIDVAQKSFTSTLSSLHPSGSDDDMLRLQDYLDAATTGVDAFKAWDNDFDGAGISLGILEAGWNVHHEDLTAAPITLCHGINRFVDAARWTDADTLVFDEGNHGTKTLGIICAQDTAEGIIGIAPGIDSIKLFSKYKDASLSIDVTAAFLSALVNLTVGDIFLIEEQNGFDTSYMPLEADSICFDLIRLLSAMGICVIEPAGNGNLTLNNDLDAEVYGSYDVTDPDRDSGAIIVSASFYEPGISTGHELLDYNLNSEGVNVEAYSNYGSRINCFAPGYRIWSTGFGRFDARYDSDAAFASSLDPNEQYGEHYETSAASAIIAGVAAVFQGAYKLLSGSVMSPMQMREYLSNPDYGTLSKNGTAANPFVDKMGVMPDLNKLLAAIGGIPDLFIRDDIADMGVVPNPHDPLWISPDIIARNSASTDPVTDFLAANLNSTTLSQEIYEKEDNYIYVRLWNRSAAPVENVTVTVYYSEPSALITPEHWNKIGDTTLPLVAGNSVQVCPPVLWNAEDIPHMGHYCFIAICDCVEDAQPVRPVNLYDFARFVRNNNNVAWRNFNIDTIPAYGIQQEFMFYLRGSQSEPDALFDINIKKPAGLKVEAIVPYEFAERNAEMLAISKLSEHDKTGYRFTLPPGEVITWNKVSFKGIPEAEIKLIIKGDEAMEKLDEIKIEVTQLYNKVNLGGLTWLLNKSKAKISNPKLVEEMLNQ